MYIIQGLRLMGGLIRKKPIHISQNPDTNHTIGTWDGFSVEGLESAGRIAEADEGRRYRNGAFSNLRLPSRCL